MDLNSTVEKGAGPHQIWMVRAGSFLGVRSENLKGRLTFAVALDLEVRYLWG